MSEKSKQIEELTHKCATLQKECDTLKTISNNKDELELLKRAKETLEVNTGYETLNLS